MYKIPEYLKSELRKVIGKLVKSEKELFNELKSREFIVSVGDMVTYTLLNNGYKPNMAIVDFRHKRENIPPDMKRKLELFGEEVINVENPPSVISDELIKCIEYAYRISKNRNVLVIVRGEEDLASLIAILLAPRGATVIYGLPDKGVVLVDVTDKEKEIVRKTLERCREHGAGDN